MSIPEIIVESEIQQAFPQFKMGYLVSPVAVSETGNGLNAKMTKVLEDIGQRMDAETIRNLSTVKATKEGYKALGKDPNRYRPAAESLLRRVSKGKGLYQVNNVVDCLNLVSVETGLSICGYDLDKIDGIIRLGVGQSEEPYEGIGRGLLNIEKLPVFRDSKGAFGTPTSDSVRTLIDKNTRHVLMMLPSFDGNVPALEAALDNLKKYLLEFVGETHPEIKVK
ncbi:B3/B4 domain-containing protein [Marinilabilia rubra]|uniref:B3/B4 tRNA-binding domain-containing protein n=1 Tax=Marinilabilia rubra TaxID=2162893 RepID=A0A2U2B4W7_9BACT|nr:phenylalanine--tRNA ligase beta subunit-related protein [Marinilabilia rubra]PWD98102.1 hypothetical protein DDZ16_17325 [Marinilabilia rubra]